MATAEEQNITTSSSADADTQYTCSPCRNDGDNSAAVKYCVNCKELLCETCCGFHRKVTFTKKHVLVDKEHNMQEFEDVNQRKYLCPQHEHVKVEYHCKTHSVFGCHACFYMHQKTCRDMRMISELSKDYLSSEDNAQTDLENIGKRSQVLIEDLQRDKQTVQRDTLSVTDAIKQFKRELLDQIDTLEKQLKEKVDKYEESELKKLDEFINKTSEIVEEYSNLSSELEILQNKNDITSLYIASENAREKLSNLTDTLKGTEDRAVMGKLVFESDTDLAQRLLSPCGFGQVSCKENISEVKQINDVNIKMADDPQDCNIYSIKVMLGNKLLMADYGNYKVKLYDANEHRVYSSMKLESRPWSVAKISTSTAVVAIPDKKTLKFFRTDPILNEGGDLIVNGKCYGVDYGDEKLVVAYSDTNKVEVMDLQGNIIHKIEKHKNGKNLFDGPMYVSIDHKHDVMYVSNNNGNSVISLKMDGTILDTYKDGDLRSPRQVSIVGSDKVFLCTSSETVHLITRDCKKVKVVLTKSNGLSYTRSMLYDEDRDLIYVGNAINTIKVFKVSYVQI